MHEILGLKVKNCPRCKRLLRENKFYDDVSTKDGKSVYCVRCERERSDK